MMDGMRADVTFDEDNDRFDVSKIIAEQNRVFKERPVENELGYRRIGRDQIPLVEFIKQNRLHMKEKLRNNESGRRIGDFAYHDLMLSDLEDDDGAYDRNLAKFKAQNGRRNLQIIDLANLRTDHNANYTNTKNKKPSNERRAPVEPLNTKRNIYNTKNIHEVVLRYLHGGKYVKTPKTRRKDTNPDNEVLLHYAVPINLKVNGYLEVP